MSRLSEHELLFDRVINLTNKKAEVEGSNFRFSYEIENRPRAVVNVDKGKDGVDSEIVINLNLYVRDLQERAEGKILVYQVEHICKKDSEFAQRSKWIRPMLETVYMEAMIIMMTLSLQNIASQVKAAEVLDNGIRQNTD